MLRIITDTKSCPKYLLVFINENNLCHGLSRWLLVRCYDKKPEILAWTVKLTT